MGNSGQTPVTPPWARETPGTQSLGEDGCLWNLEGSTKPEEHSGASRTSRDRQTVPAVKHTPLALGSRALAAPARPPHLEPGASASHLRSQFRGIHSAPLPPGPLRSSAAPTFDFPATSLQRERRPRPSTPLGRHHRDAGRRPERLQPQTAERTPGYWPHS